MTKYTICRGVVFGVGSFALLAVLFVTADVLCMKYLGVSSIDDVASYMVLGSIMMALPFFVSLFFYLRLR